MLRTTRVTVLSVAAALGALLLAAYGSAMAQPSHEEGPPVVFDTSPADGESGFDRDYPVLVLFSEKMRERSINGKTLRLFEGDERVRATVSYEFIGRTTDKQAVLDPKSRLKPKTEYTVVVEGAADDDGRAVKDLDGTPMAADYTFSFTTGNN